MDPEAALATRRRHPTQASCPVRGALRLNQYCSGYSVRDRNVVSPQAMPRTGRIYRWPVSSVSASCFAKDGMETEKLPSISALARIVKPQLASCSRNLVRDKEKQVRGRSYRAKGANRMTGTALAAIGLGPPWTDRARLWVRATGGGCRLDSKIAAVVWPCDRRKAPLQKLTS